MVFHVKLQAQQQSQQNPSQGNPLGGCSQLLIKAGGLVLAHIGVGIARQSAGQTSLLTGLEQNDQHHCHTGDNLQNSQNNLHNFHDFTSLRLPNRSSLNGQRIN